MTLQLKKLYKVSISFTAADAKLTQAHGFSFAAHCPRGQEKIHLDDSYLIERGSILMVTEKRKPTRSREWLPHKQKPKFEYSFLTLDGKTIETLNPDVDFFPTRFLKLI